MIVKSTCRGWEIKQVDEIWVYPDTGEPCWGEKDRRPCKWCGKEPTKEGYDACLGKLEGVTAACCGHGVREGWITDEFCSKPSSCTAQCERLQSGKCERLSIDEINILLDKTDWDDLDKGEIITPYILKEDKMNDLIKKFKEKLSINNHSLNWFHKSYIRTIPGKKINYSYFTQQVNDPDKLQDVVKGAIQGYLDGK